MCFLKHRDQCSLALTAKKFYEAYHDPKVAKNIVLRFDFCILDVNSNPLKLFSKSTFKYQRLILGACIKDIILNDKEVCVTFWKRFGKNFKEIVIETPGKMGMILIAKYMPNIKKLKIRNPGTRSICFGKNEKMGLQRNLCNVTQLEICSNYEQLEEILELIPKLEILELGGFNCKQQRTYNRNNALSIHFLIHYITKVRALELKGLLLHSYCVELSANELFFYNLANVTGLLLQKLTCSIEGAPIELLRQLFHNMQNSLRSLDVTSWAGISAEIYSLIFTHLRNIENLTFRGRLNMNGLLQVSELKYLKVLKFTDTFKDIESKNEVIHFLSKLKLCENLQELQIDTKCLNSTECKICFKEFVTHLNVTNNLQILNISKSNIDDKNLSLLIFCLRNLKELYMNDCKYITKFECHKKCKAKVKNEPVKIGQLICQLQVLELSHCINLVTDGIQSLFYLTNLRELSLNNLESVSSDNQFFKIFVILMKVERECRPS